MGARNLALSARLGIISQRNIYELKPKSMK
jgi:hypothetical protein